MAKKNNRPDGSCTVFLLNITLLTMCYTELQVTSNFSFLRGASHPEELVIQAQALGHSAIAITDRNTLAGIVRGHVAAKKRGIRLISACRLDLLDGPSLLAYPTDKDAYSRLSTLLTIGNLRAEKGSCHLYKADVYRHAKGMKFMIVPPTSLNELFDFEASFYGAAEEYREALGPDCYLAASRLYGGDNGKQLYRLSQLAGRLDIPLTATNDVYYHDKGRRPLQDILTCIREKCTIYNAGFRLHANAERHMKHPDEMQRLFRQYPDAIRPGRAPRNALAIAFRKRSSLLFVTSWLLSRRWIMPLFFSRCGTSCVLRMKTISSARVVGLLRIRRFVIVLGSRRSTRLNLTCFLSGLSHRPEMNHRISMWISNTSDARR